MDIVDNLFFDSGETVARVFVSVPLVYVGVVVLVRVGGKRTTSQMNNFDWVVTVAMGALVATGIVSRSVPLADALLAIALLIGIQYATTLAVQRSAAFAAVIKPEPRLLVRDGRFLERSLAAERVTEAEVLGVVRGQGIASLGEVAAVVLETDGTLSVLPGRSEDIEGVSALDDVVGPPE